MRQVCEESRDETATDEQPEQIQDMSGKNYGNTSEGKNSEEVKTEEQLDKELKKEEADDETQEAVEIVPADEHVIEQLQVQEGAAPEPASNVSVSSEVSPSADVKKKNRQLLLAKHEAAKKAREERKEIRIKDEQSKRTDNMPPEAGNRVKAWRGSFQAGIHNEHVKSESSSGNSAGSANSRTPHTNPEGPDDQSIVQSEAVPLDPAPSSSGVNVGEDGGVGGEGRRQSNKMDDSEAPADNKSDPTRSENESSFADRSYTSTTDASSTTTAPSPNTSASKPDHGQESQSTSISSSVAKSTDLPEDLHDKESPATDDSNVDTNSNDKSKKGILSNKVEPAPGNRDVANNQEATSSSNQTAAPASHQADETPTSKAAAASTDQAVTASNDQAAVASNARVAPARVAQAWVASSPHTAESGQSNDQNNVQNGKPWYKKYCTIL